MRWQGRDRHAEAIKELDTALAEASEPGMFQGASTPSIKADAVRVKAGILFEERRFQEALDALTSIGQMPDWHCAYVIESGYGAIRKTSHATVIGR